MSDFTSITENSRLFCELRQGLWHCTSAPEFRQILKDGSINPNDGRVKKWSQSYACQQLGGVSLFDFQAPTDQQVIETANRWGPFVYSSARRTTVVIGLSRTALQAKLVPYPKNKVNTTGNVIPYVETCHCGPIPITAITKCLLICSVDCAGFYVENALADPRLAEIEREFQKWWSDRQQLPVEPTIAGMPEEELDRIRALARARAFGGAVEVETWPVLPPQPEIEKT